MRSIRAAVLATGRGVPGLFATLARRVKGCDFTLGLFGEFDHVLVLYHIFEVGPALSHSGTFLGSHRVKKPRVAILGTVLGQAANFELYFRVLLRDGHAHESPGIRLRNEVAVPQYNPLSNHFHAPHGGGKQYRFNSEFQILYIIMNLQC